MVHAADLHTVFSELHVGSLTLAAVALLALAFHAVHMRFLRGRWARLDRLSQTVPWGADPVAYLGAAFGIVGFVGSVATGVFAWRPEALWSSGEVLNKVMVSLLGLELWIAFVFLRFRYGTQVLASRRFLPLYLGVGFVAFALTAVAASLGGHLAGKESILDPVYAAVGVKTTTLWLLPPFAWVAGLAYGAAPLFGMPIPEFYRLLVFLDLLVAAAVLLSFAATLRRPATAGASPDIDPCHPEADAAGTDSRRPFEKGASDRSLPRRRPRRFIPRRAAGSLTGTKLALFLRRARNRGKSPPKRTKRRE
jgi:hypothetical protein